MHPDRKTRPAEAMQQLSPSRVASLLRRARMLQRVALEAPPDEAQALFRLAAGGLGARVAVMRSRLSVADSPQDVQNTARMLGQLYDAVAYQGLDPVLVQRIGRHAGIPVVDGAASMHHPAARLFEQLDGQASTIDNRRLVLQALLLEAASEQRAQPCAPLIQRKRLEGPGS